MFLLIPPSHIRLPTNVLYNKQKWLQVMHSWLANKINKNSSSYCKLGLASPHIS